MSRGDGALYSEFQYIMGNGQIWPSPEDRETHMSESITFPQLHSRVYFAGQTVRRPRSRKSRKTESSTRSRTSCKVRQWSITTCRWFPNWSRLKSNPSPRHTSKSRTSVGTLFQRKVGFPSDQRKFPSKISQVLSSVSYYFNLSVLIGLK